MTKNFGSLVGRKSQKRRYTNPKKPTNTEHTIGHASDCSILSEKLSTRNSVSLITLFAYEVSQIIRIGVAGHG